MATFRFTAGPWSILEGGDVELFGGGISMSLDKKIGIFKDIGMDGVMFHDDDVVPDINNLTEQQIINCAKDVKAELDKHGLFAEFVAPRLWLDPRTKNGGLTAISKEDLEFAKWRAHRTCDIAKVLGTDKILLWLAREGTFCAESKSPVDMTHQLVDSINDILTYYPTSRVLIQPKHSGPVDRSICGTAGHVLAVGANTMAPSRVGLCLASSAQAGLEPAHDMGFALAFNKLWSVHINDQNGITQDKAFGVENLRSAFNQVKVLYENNFGDRGNFECVGLDVMPMSIQTYDDCYRHLVNSKKIFEMLLEKVKKFDYAFQAACVKEQNFEKLEMYVMELLMTG